MTDETDAMVTVHLVFCEGCQLDEHWKCYGSKPWRDALRVCICECRVEENS